MPYVVVAGVVSPTGASHQLLIAAADQRLRVLVSVPLMLEWEAVLKRPEILRATKGNAQDMDIVLDQLAAVCTPVNLHFLWRPRTNDPDDDMVLDGDQRAGECDRDLQRSPPRSGGDLFRDRRGAAGGSSAEPPMSRTFALRLPESIKRAAEDLARADGVSLNQFIATAVAEKVSALSTATYFRTRAARARRAKFDEVLTRLGSLPPREGDEVEGN